MQQNPSAYSYLTVSPRLCDKLDSNEVRVWAGLRNCNALLQCDDSNAISQTHIDKHSGNRLLIPAGGYNIYYCSGTDIRLGPIVGVLSSSKRKYPSGKKAHIFKELFDMAQSKGLFIYRFHPEDVNPRKKTVNGYTFNSYGQLYSSTFPMPDIVYNRIRYRDIEKRTDVKRLLRYFREEPGIYLFNSRFLNKLEVYNALSNSKECAGFMPDTAQLSTKSLKYFLGKYGSVYLKPVANSLGHGIVKVNKRIGNEYTVQFSNSSYQRIRHNISLLPVHLKQSGLHPNNYLVQKNIDLATLHGRVFDLRVQVQKNINGEWILTGAGVRVAGPNRIVTHIPNGGSAKAYNPVIDHVFGTLPKVKAGINEQLLLICGLVPRVLNEQLPVELAIISMDIGIDKKGQLWLIEVNSKPSYFNEPNIRAVHTKTLVEYFIFSALNNLGGRE